MRVFVLGTGRCGTMTFVEAAKAAATNYTAGHETRSRLLGEDRFAYPDWHIEADNRLSWFLGGLERRFDHDATVYVHLRRDPSAVTASFVRRLDTPPLRTRLSRARHDVVPTRVIRAFAHGLVMRRQVAEADKVPIASFYVDAVTENIEAFLAGKPHVVELWVDALDEGAVRRMWKMAEAEGDVDRFLAGMGEVHNAT